MAAGLGFKTFNTGDVLSASDTNGYLMQGVLVFASAAARDSAITSPQEGQFAYLKDTNVTTYYTGSAWANLDTTGMTNPMTTTGDTIYSSSGSTPARLGIGTTGQVLTVAAGVPSWATPAGGGGKVLQVVYASTTTSTTISTASFTSTNLTGSITPTLATSKVLILVNQIVKTKRATSSAYAAFRIMRGATEIYAPNPVFEEGMLVEATGISNIAIGGWASFQYLDDPATTSSTTYTINARPNSASASPQVICQENSSTSNMILMEIGA